MKVEILLATYNGEKYLREQLESLLNQSYEDLHVIIRDDGSSDHTQAIIQDFVTRFPTKVTFIQDKIHLGALACFSELMGCSKAPYMMFADQDDIWLKDKVTTTLNKMKEMEKKYGETKPILVHTDLIVVDEKKNQIAPSFWTYTGLKPVENPYLQKILVQNEVTGCTMMMNRALVDLAFPVESYSAMHDWWVGIVAAAFGHIGLICEPQILYRQHGKNTLGAVKFGSLNHLKKRKATQIRKMAQAKAFQKRFEKYFSKEQSKMLNDFISMSDSSVIKNRFLTIKHGFYRHGFLRNLYCFLFSKYP